jgi:hypothetical protein
MSPSFKRVHPCSDRCLVSLDTENSGAGAMHQDFAQVWVPGIPLNRIQLRYARDVRPNDLKNRPVILLGSKEGTPWVQLFEDKMNFVFVHDDQKQRFAGGGSAMGIGIWSMHYLGLKALDLPVPMLNNPAVPLSILAAIFASGITLLVVSGKSDSGRHVKAESQRVSFDLAFLRK